LDSGGDDWKNSGGNHARMAQEALGGGWEYEDSGRGCLEALRAEFGGIWNCGICWRQIEGEAERVWAVAVGTGSVFGEDVAGAIDFGSDCSAQKKIAFPENNCCNSYGIAVV
jgi:hypothetical protein